MHHARTKLSRRNFLFAATAGTAAATAAAVIGNNQTEQPVKEDSARTDGQGYQATAHVQNYYRTARI